VLQGKQLNVLDGIDAGRKNEEKRSGGPRVLEGNRDIHRLIGDEELPDGVRDKGLQSGREAVRAETAQHQQPLEVREVLPVRRHLFVLWLLCLCPHLPPIVLTHIRREK
jgi:hypothetical protein